MYDPVGGAFAEPAVRAMGWKGRYLVIGFAAGEIPKIPLNLTLLKGCDIRGVFWGAFADKEPEAHRDNLQQLMTWAAQGKLRAHVGQVFAPERNCNGAGRAGAAGSDGQTGHPFLTWAKFSTSGNSFSRIRGRCRCRMRRRLFCMWPMRSHRLWQQTEDDLGRIGLPPPFWAFAWAGGQALARYILDHPALVRGKHVFDFASGSGLVAIAAMKAGAATARASEIDPFALEAIAINAALNGVTVAVIAGDVLDRAVAADVICAGDVFYDRDMAARVRAG